LDIRALIIDHQVLLARGKHEFERGPIGDLLQPNDVGIQQGDDRLQVGQSLGLGDHAGAQELDIIGCHADLRTPRCWGEEQDGQEPQHRG
jgi:hypothetical protein